MILAAIGLAYGFEREEARVIALTHDKPINSPAKALGRKIASAFSGNAAIDTKSGQWEEF